MMDQWMAEEMELTHQWIEGEIEMTHQLIQEIKMTYEEAEDEEQMTERWRRRWKRLTNVLSWSRKLQTNVLKRSRE